MNRLTQQQKAFVSEIQNLTDQGIIHWQRKGNELHATIALELSVSDPLVDPLRSLVVNGGSARQVYLPLPEGALLEQCLEIEEFASAEGRTGAAAANVAEY